MTLSKLQEYTARKSSYTRLIEKVVLVIETENIQYIYPKYLFTDKGLELYFFLKSPFIIKVTSEQDRIFYYTYRISSIKKFTLSQDNQNMSSLHIELQTDDNFDFICYEDTNYDYEVIFSDSIDEIYKYLLGKLSV